MKKIDRTYLDPTRMVVSVKSRINGGKDIVIGLQEHSRDDYAIIVFENSKVKDMNIFDDIKNAQQNFLDTQIKYFGRVIQFIPQI